jgi:hypothetical protein
MLDLIQAGEDPEKSVKGMDLTLAMQRDWDGATHVKGGFTPGEEAALSDYQWGETGWGNSYFGELNAYKRGNQYHTPDEDELDELAQMDEDLQTALFKSKTTERMTVFRGVRDGQPPLKVGDTLIDKAWVSTSVSPELAFQFGRGADGRIMVIDLPKGTHALRPNDPDELEVVVGPDTPMKVSRIEGNLLYMELT